MDHHGTLIIKGGIITRRKEERRKCLVHQFEYEIVFMEGGTRRGWQIWLLLSQLGAL